MSTPPTTQAIRHLYAATLRTARAFSSYNFRQYFLRRTRGEFRNIQTDSSKLSSFYNSKTHELAVLRRSAIVNQLYGGWRLVVEDQKPQRIRDDN
ncbi:hypothetical protein OBBRIDRAFT_722361 [Obba rivulosa]|uniref:Complex 1 LYR protein domain-containing protein n=1 Tax=Obba rivulosa TaxID=1052685 RepID=A0A8E2DRM8_9APHY|nr:hypothetical protein OBBRIDRAFT_722361 [Obba rivulosa]